MGEGHSIGADQRDGPGPSASRQIPFGHDTEPRHRVFHILPQQHAHTAAGRGDQPACFPAIVESVEQVRQAAPQLRPAKQVFHPFQVGLGLGGSTAGIRT